jgi:diguanylate cyclase (GGDEF)-like protein
MAQQTSHSVRAKTGTDPDKIKFIGLFVGSVVIGVVLVLIAVFNASTELAVVQEVGAMHDMMQDRLTKALALQPAARGPAATEGLAARLSTDNYRVLPVYESAARPGERAWEWRGVRFSWERIERSRIGAHGGYLEEGPDLYTWTLLALPGSGDRLLVLHRHQPLAARALLGVYQNRLIVPAAFFVWMTVWVSLILNGLVTRLRTQKDAVESLAWQDPLTGLPNRNLFFKTLERLVGHAHAEGRSFSLAVVDLDGFKGVNDAHGHDAGDALLQQVADRFRKAVRQDDMVARTGGDEFILLLPDSGAEGCHAVCVRIVQELGADYLVLGHRVRISASMGVARFPDDAREIDELTRTADKSMYAAKRSGGGTICYSNQGNGFTANGLGRAPR